MRIKRFYIVLSILPLIAAVVGFFALLDSPRVGMKFEVRDGKWVLKDVAADGPAASLRSLVGSEVVSIGDHAVERYSLLKAWDEPETEKSFEQWYAAQKYFSEHLRPGIPLIITFHAVDGRRLQVDITPVSFTVLQVVKAIGLHYLVACVLILMALFVTLKKPADPKARLFFMFSFLLSIIMFSFIAWFHRDLAMNIHAFKLLFNTEQIPLCLVSISFLHFTLVFPTRNKYADRKGVLTALYAAPVLCLLHSLLVGATFSRTGFIPGDLLELTVFSGGFLGGIAVMTHSFMNVKSPVEKAQIQWIFWALFGVIFIMLAFSYIPMLVEHRSLVDPDFYLLLVLLIPLSMAFSIMKYRLMDIDRLLDNTIVYSIILSALVLLDAGVISTLVRFDVIDVRSRHSFLALAILVWIVIFTYIPLRERLKLIIKKLLKREIYNINDVAIRLCSQLLSVDTVPGVTARAEAVITDALHPRGIRIFFFDEEENSEKGGGTEPGRERPNAAGDPAKVSYLLSAAGRPAIHDDGIVVPLIDSQRTFGCFLLESKHSDRLYNSEDIKLLRIVAGQTASAVENIRSRERALKNEKEFKEEKERISREIHDGISSEFAGIFAWSEKGERHLVDSASREELAELLTSIKDASRRGLQELRSIIWAVGSEYENTTFLLPYIKRYASGCLGAVGIDLTVTQEGLENDFVLSPAMRLVIMRLVQEACHNIMKHSGASKAKIAFCAANGRLELKIEDDGKGFDLAEAGPGNGLKNMRRRVKDAGGDLEIESGPEMGTGVSARLPLHPL